ncbi:Chitobiosyldiphosphodolichol beta-mannosyltransferase-like protein [Elsinoe fawcettii]|nr:Chitobiosyldiphosphodolichol beta-mannosyltransferase-like protein [Elsinoe fawcettii]
MAKTWLALSLEVGLTLAVAVSTIVSLILFTLPSSYSPHGEERINLNEFTEADIEDPDSGYRYVRRSESDSTKANPVTSVIVFVLGDIGRSPRMQYHALSIAKHGGRVDLVGYTDTDVLPEIKKHKLIRVVPLTPLPDRLRTDKKAAFILVAPFKVLFQLWSIYRALGYHVFPRKFMLVQNPPSVPTLLIAQVVCMIRNIKLIVDWHNLGHTILALKLGEKHALVKASQAYERSIARYVHKNITVSNAMTRLLNKEYCIEAHAVHDRPAKQFRPLDASGKLAILNKLTQTQSHSKQFASGKRRLVVSSTSWTPDEDFSILLDALVAYSATVEMSSSLPKLTVIITGKGQLKDYYLKQITNLVKKKKLNNVDIHAAWLTMEDYASLLGAADLGVSLHTSSSGVDLPMKVVDMFGAGLPVVAWDKFEAWPELVQEGVNGRGFQSAEGLERLLEELFRQNGSKLAKLRDGAMEESKRRWEDEWPKAAGLFDIPLESVRGEGR